jgi:hypothetical protein
VSENRGKTKERNKKPAFEHIYACRENNEKGENQLSREHNSLKRET